MFDVFLTCFIYYCQTMFYVAISVACSVTVSVILKLARQYQIDTTQLIVWNYPIAAILTFLFFQPQLESLSGEAGKAPWGIYITLGILLPCIFVALSRSICYTGIVKTEIAQRLSLFIPLIAAFWFFGEKFNFVVLIGIVVGLAAILCSIGWHKEVASIKSSSSSWLYPLLVFVGYGVVDILFKTIAQVIHVPYTTSMFVVFVLAMIFGFGYICYLYFIRNTPISVKAAFWGLGLGAFNFANILFYMKAHRALPDNPSLVFTGMNIGVITLGAVIGMLFFGEKLSLLNKIGLFLAIMSVVIISINS